MTHFPSPLSAPIRLAIAALVLAACGGGKGGDDDDDGDFVDEACDLPCEAQVLADGIQTPRTVRADDHYVYWGGWFGPHLQRVSRLGGQIEVVHEAGVYASSFQLDGDHIYYANDSLTTLNRSKKDGSEAEVLASGFMGVDGLAVGGDWLYFADMLAGELYRVPLEGGEPELLEVGLVGPRDLLVEGDTVFFTTNEGADVRRRADGDSTSSVLSSDHGVPYGALAADETQLHWTSLGGATNDHLLSMPKEGGATTAFRNSGALAMVLDDGYRYWTYGLGREIRRVPVDAESPVEQLIDIGTTLSIPQAGMVVVDGFLFYSRYEADDGMIERIPLCNCTDLPTLDEGGVE
jgi:hypothetical protein